MHQGAGQAGARVRQGDDGGQALPGVAPVTDEDAPASPAARRWASMSSSWSAFQVRVIELKLQLEGAIRQAAALAQQGNRLIHHRDKVHPVPSPPGARFPVHARPTQHSGDGENVGRSLRERRASAVWRDGIGRSVAAETLSRACQGIKGTSEAPSTCLHALKHLRHREPPCRHR